MNATKCPNCGANLSNTHYADLVEIVSSIDRELASLATIRGIDPNYMTVSLGAFNALCRLFVGHPFFRMNRDGDGAPVSIAYRGKIIRGATHGVGNTIHFHGANGEPIHCLKLLIPQQYLEEKSPDHE